MDVGLHPWRARTQNASEPRINTGRAREQRYYRESVSRKVRRQHRNRRDVDDNGGIDENELEGVCEVE